MGKIKVLQLDLHYPFTLGSYFQKAWRMLPDVELKTCGPYTGTYIPWKGGMHLSPKYDNRPDVLCGGASDTSRPVPYQYVRQRLRDWEPDLIVDVSTTSWWSGVPEGDKRFVSIATDPHVLNYDKKREYSILYNMQKCYADPYDRYFSYAFCTQTHRQHDVQKTHDAALIGMAYPQRTLWVDELRKRGHSVIFENGPVFEEATELYNHAYFGLSWSSKNDLIARVFEVMAMGLTPIINRVPDLSLHFEEGKHYLGFSNLQEAVEKFEWAKQHPEEAAQIAQNAKDLMWEDDGYGYPEYSYVSRCARILRECL